MTRQRLGGLLAALALLVLGAAQAQAAYPDRPIRIIVGFAAGGGNDLFARLVMQKFQDNTGATVVIENKTGAGGRIAAGYVANSTPDGYTVLVGATGQIAIAAAIYNNLNYDPKKLVPLNMIASFPLILVVPATSPIKSVKELVAWAKAHADKANYGTSPRARRCQGAGGPEEDGGAARRADRRRIQEANRCRHREICRGGQDCQLKFQ
jgi:tripartite-type tricarboxylate transporter receptor subunit TctC